MIVLPVLLILSVQFHSIRTQKNPHFAPERNTIVHLFEWKWTDIARECETFLSKQNYAGVQVSSPAENLIVSHRPWKERYQPVSYNLSSRSGDAGEFSDMVSRCNKVGIRIYVDVVLNHMAAQPGKGTAGNAAFSDLKIYPGSAYQPEHFHPTCPIEDYLEPDVIRNCEMNGLRDLDHSSPKVQSTIVAYLNRLIGYGVAGFRIDSAKYIWPDELSQLLGRVTDLNVDVGFPVNSRPFIYQDVPQFEKDVVDYSEYVPIGRIEENNFGLALARAFTNLDNLTNLQELTRNYDLLPDSQDALVFVDSHLTQRKSGFLNYKSLRAYKMAMAFSLAYPYGTTRMISSYFFDDDVTGPPQDTSGKLKSPVFYQDGTCGNGYVCEHRWPQFYNMVQFRRVVGNAAVENWTVVNGTLLAFSRGKLGLVAFASRGNFHASVRTSLPAGIYCDVISGEVQTGKCTGRSVTVNGGLAAIRISDDDYEGVVAIHIDSRLN